VSTGWRCGSVPGQPDEQRDPLHLGLGARIQPHLDAVSRRLGAFPGPALLVWGMADRFFKPAFARRLRVAFADARLVEIEGGRTFVPHDHFDRLAQEIAAFQVAGVSSR
jgi:pimeloyl-ACP methyl ester carboxylesterase